MLFMEPMMLNTPMSTQEKNKHWPGEDDPCDDCSDHKVLSDWIKTQPVKKEVDNQDDS